MSGCHGHWTCLPDMLMSGCHRYCAVCYVDCLVVMDTVTAYQIRWCLVVYGYSPVLVIVAVWLSWILNCLHYVDVWFPDFICWDTRTLVCTTLMFWPAVHFRYTSYHVCNIQHHPLSRSLIQVDTDLFQNYIDVLKIFIQTNYLLVLHRTSGWYVVGKCSDRLELHFSHFS